MRGQPITAMVTIVANKPVSNAADNLLRLFARPWPVVKLFRQRMERNLRPDPVADAI
jgi:hypothetical protein